MGVTSESITLARGGDEAEALDGLVERARAGEEAAFEEILTRFEGKALAIAHHLGASREDAEDIAQEGFLKLFRHIDAYRGGRRFTSWFYRIILNVARDHLQKAAIHRGAGASPGAGRELESYPSADAAASHDLEVRQRTRAALLQLSLREREVVILKDIQGLSVWEISRILRLDPITVRRHAMRARARLRDLLK